ncbi:MAG: YqeG family HAD IIIA-type phosphatase [Armatimonadota bacterium]
MSDFLQKFCPNEFIDSVQEIDIVNLRSKGITALLIDLDNTLVPWQGYDIPNQIIEWIRKVSADGMKVCLVSNTRTSGRLERISSILNVEFSVKAMKPRRAGFLEALRLLDVNPNEAAVVGDQIFTDVFGGNRLGIYTILVRPMYRREFFGTKISRFFEFFLMKTFRKRGWLEKNRNK